MFNFIKYTNLFIFLIQNGAHMPKLTYIIISHNIYNVIGGSTYHIGPSIKLTKCPKAASSWAHILKFLKVCEMAQLQVYKSYLCIRCKILKDKCLTLKRG